MGASNRKRLGRRITLVAVPFTAVIGGMVKDLGLVNALAGAIGGSLIAFVFPAAMFYTAVHRERRRSRDLIRDRHLQFPRDRQLQFLQVVALVVGLFGLGSGIIGT